MASLGRAVDMPLTVGGVAEYNIANIMAASLAAHALGVPADAIRETVRIFGKTHADNPGRLERWTVGSVNVVMDYAHNPDGLERLLRVCATLRGSGGRLLLLLGQAGNRTDEDIRALANVAASFSPERIAIKELPGMLRGRLPGEVPALLQAALVAAGTSAVRIETIEGEAEAALRLIGLARPGDVVVLPVHQSAAHQSLRAHLDGLSANLPASA
jgi:UDP-N-acetylmuramyl tripeptide synthase